jgi:hypothetical protein
MMLDKSVHIFQYYFCSCSSTPSLKSGRPTIRPDPMSFYVGWGGLQLPIIFNHTLGTACLQCCFSYYFSVRGTVAVFLVTVTITVN